MKRTAATTIPREIPREAPCPRCGCTEPVQNGAWCQGRRKAANITLEQMSNITKLSVTYLSKMERGEKTFRRDIAAVYERLFERRRKAGDG